MIAQLQQFVGEVLGVSDYDTVKLTTEEVLAILKARGRPLSPNVVLGRG